MAYQYRLEERPILDPQEPTKYGPWGRAALNVFQNWMRPEPNEPRRAVMPIGTAGTAGTAQEWNTDLARRETARQKIMDKAAAIPSATSQRQQTHLRGGIPSADYAANRNNALVNTAYNATAALRGTNPTFDTAYMNKYYPDNFPVNTYDPKVAKGLPGMGYGGVGGSDTGAALRAAADRGDWDAINRYYASKGQSFAGMAPPKQRGQRTLEDMLTAPGVKNTKAMNRIADIMNARERNQALMDMTGMQGANQMALQEARQAWETPYKESTKSKEELQNKIAQQALDLSGHTGALKALDDQIRAVQSGGNNNPQLLADLLQQQKIMYSNYIEKLRAMGYYPEAPKDATEKKAQGGLVGYAQGGPIQPVLNPMGNMGMPSSMASLDPVVRQYGQYVSTATQYGLQPLPFTKFIDLMASARQQLQQLPTQAGMQMMADGGLIDDQNLPWWKRMLGGSSERDQLVKEYEANQAKQAMPEATPQPKAGLANIPEAMKSRKARLDEIMNEIRGYAEGGAIPVAGRQVLGPGTGTSDSIPAVIDGSRPAALSTGEFVFPKQAVQYFGTDKLNKMIEKAKGTK